MRGARLNPAILDAQLALFRRLREEAGDAEVRVGWKVGHAIAEVDALSPALPAVGWISPRSVLRDGDTYRVGAARALRAETEVVIVLGRSIGAEAADDAIRSAIAGFRVALEIVDVARPPADGQAIIRGNLFHRAVVIGEPHPGRGSTIGSATLSVNGRVHEADEEPRDPVTVVREVARVLSACGECLIAGDRILAGSVVHVPVAAGDELRAEIDGLGSAAARLG